MTAAQAPLIRSGLVEMDDTLKRELLKFDIEKDHLINFVRERLILFGDGKTSELQAVEFIVSRLIQKL